MGTLFLSGLLLLGPPLEIPREDALRLANLSYEIALLEADLREKYAERNRLVLKYLEEFNISLEDYDLDLRQGRFVKKNEKTSDAPPAAGPSLQ